MRAKLDTPRRLFWFDTQGVVLDQLLLTSVVTFGGTTFNAVLAWEQNVTYPQMLSSEEITFTTEGTYYVVISYGGTAVASFQVNVGQFPTPDYVPADNAAYLQLTAEVLGAGESIVAVVIDPDGVDGDEIAAPYSAAKVAYVTAQDEYFPTVGSYAVLWIQDVAGTPTPIRYDDVLVSAIAGKETLQVIVRADDSPSGTPIGGVTVVFSDSDGAAKAQEITDGSGRCTASLSPGTYTMSLLKSTYVFTINNFTYEVVNTEAEAWVNRTYLVTNYFIPTVSSTASPANTCTLYARLYTLEGKPLHHADVQVALVGYGQVFALGGVFDTKRVYTTDSNGYVSFTLAQGAEIEVSIAPVGVRRIITVPSGNDALVPVDLLSLLSAANDLYDIIRPSGITAPRRAR